MQKRLPEALKVTQASADEVFTDTIRIPKAHRGGISNGSVVRIDHNGKCALAIVRGFSHDPSPAARMDEFVRERLDVKVRDYINVADIRLANWHEKLRWYWNASSPAIYVPARVAVISLVLGVMSILLGAWSIWLAIA